MTICLNHINNMFLMNSFARSAVKGCLSAIVKMNLNTLDLCKFCLIKQQHVVHFQYMPFKALPSKIAQNDDVWAMLNQEKTPEDQDVIWKATLMETSSKVEFFSLSNLYLHFYID